MARGDFVRTSVGAIRQGARSIVSSILAAGGSVSAAAQALLAAFPSLPGRVAGGLATGGSRTFAAAQRRFEAGTQQNLPIQNHEPIQGLLAPFRYLVLADYTLPSGRGAQISHWIESAVPLTFEQLRSQAEAQDALFRPREKSDSPRGQRIPENTPEPSFTLVRAQVRA